MEKDGDDSDNSHCQTSSVYEADKPFYFLHSHFQWSVCKFLIRN